MSVSPQRRQEVGSAVGAPPNATDELQQILEVARRAGEQPVNLEEFVRRNWWPGAHHPGVKLELESNIAWASSAPTVSFTKSHLYFDF